LSNLKWVLSKRMVLRSASTICEMPSKKIRKSNVTINSADFEKNFEN